MRIPLKHFHAQSSFPEMDGGSHATDSRANDAHGFDVEALVSHISSRGYRILRISSSTFQDAITIQISQL
jgi:hypothetical protein